MKDKYNDLPKFLELVQQLIEVVDEANHWVYELEKFPPPSEYPQYHKIRKLGNLIYEAESVEGMIDACTVLHSRCRHPSPHCESYLIAWYSWADIGEFEV